LYGGGLYGCDSVNGCIISGNSAFYGGGLSNCGNISNCTIENNMAERGGGGMDFYGGYYVEYYNFTNLTISNCIIRDNFVSDNGGGIWVGVDGINTTIKNCEIVGNMSVGGWGGGGGLWCYGKINILNCTIADNITDGSGGGVFCFFGDSWYDPTYLTVRNSIIWNNISSDGSELTARRSDIIIYGNNISSDGSELTARRSDFFGSKISSDGSELSAYGRGYSSLLEISYSDIRGGRSGVSVSANALIWGPGNINRDPLFVNRYADDYRLSIASACIDAGTDVGVYDGIAGVYDDIEGNIRPFDFPGIDNNESEPEFDIGAHEVVAAEIDMLVTPKRIKRNGRHRDIKVTVKLTEYEAEHIDGKFILFPGAITAKRQEVQDDEGELKVIAYFDRNQLLAAIPYNGMVELTVAGKFEPDRYFYGNGNIEIIQP
jgi:hypothetical protein